MINNILKILCYSFAFYFILGIISIIWIGLTFDGKFDISQIVLYLFISLIFAGMFWKLIAIYLDKKGIS